MVALDVVDTPAASSFAQGSHTVVSRRTQFWFLRTLTQLDVSNCRVFIHLRRVH